MNKFDKWNEIKKELHNKEKFPHFHEREIWFANVGQNIDIEQNGKGQEFLRPVLIIKKFNKKQFLAIMLTSKCKDSKFLFKLKDNSCINLSQIRTFSAKRLLRYMYKLKTFKFEEILNKIFEVTLPKKGGLGLNASISERIISNTNLNVKYQNFDKWNEIKKSVENKNKLLKFRERDIFFIHFGKNIGYEQNGKGDEFLRPVLVLRKFSNRYFLGIPLSSKEKKGNYFFNFYFKNRYETALLNQARVFDIKRAKYLLGNLDKKKFLEIKKAFVELLTLPKEGSGLKRQNYNDIIPQNNNNVKTILFDLDMSKWVLFFNPIIKKLKKLGHSVIITSRGGEDYSELNKVIELYNLDYISIGEYGGASLEGKLKASLYRMDKLTEIVKNVDVVVSGSVVDINRVAFGLGKKVINFYDMPIRDYTLNLEKVLPQIKLTIPLSTKVFKPFIVPDEIYLKLGVDKKQIIEYNFIDPLIWLKDFKPNLEYIKKEIPKIDFNKKIVVIREEEFKASYVGKRYNFLDEAIKELQKENFNLIIIPRYEAKHLKDKFKNSIILEKKIILQHLLAFTDLFIGGGGTINIEATYFGVPVISTRSFISHYDKFLIDNNLMWHSNDKKEIINLAKSLIGKKPNSKEVFDKMEVDIDMFVKGILE